MTIWTTFASTALFFCPLPNFSTFLINNARKTKRVEMAGLLLSFNNVLSTLWSSVVLFNGAFLCLESCCCVSGGDVRWRIKTRLRSKGCPDPSRVSSAQLRHLAAVQRTARRAAEGTGNGDWGGRKHLWGYKITDWLPDLIEWLWVSIFSLEMWTDVCLDGANKTGPIGVPQETVALINV